MLNAVALVPILRALSDFGRVLIDDDKKDIMVFSTASHRSPVHHNQWGFLMKLLADTGINLIWMGQKMLKEETRTNIQLKDIQRLLQEQKDRQILEDQAQEVRARQMKSYMSMLSGSSNLELPQQAPIYGGNLNDIRVDRPKALPSYPTVPKAPKI